MKTFFQSKKTRNAQIFGLINLAIIVLFSSSCKKDEDNTPSQKIVYVESNDANNNSILAYKRGDDGQLTVMQGSPYSTGGKGTANPKQILGPDDNDKPMVLSTDKKRLFAVNSGSNTISVFDIKTDGSLSQVSGSPFPSGGINPVSVGINNGYLYVVNKNQDPNQIVDTSPNYTVFSIGGDGKLTAVVNSTVTTATGSSPSYAYVSKNGNFLFGTDFLGFMSKPVVGTLRSFTIKSDGTLNANSPQTIPGEGGALGLAEHPKDNVIYVGFPMQGKVGIYTIDPSNGVLTFKSTIAAGKAACWLRTNSDGSRLYILNSAESTISVYDISNSQSPSSKQTFTLKSPGPLFDSMSPAGMVTSSQPFHEELSPDGKNLYVISQHANPDFSTNFNYFHVLKINEDGTLTEPSDPSQLPVAPTVRPQGIVIF